MKIHIISLIIITLLLSNCRTLNYIIDNSTTEQEKKAYNQSIENKTPIPKKGIIEGLYIEKGKNYRFLTKYNIPEKKFTLTLYTLLDNNIIFDAEYKNNEVLLYSVTLKMFSLKAEGIVKDFAYSLFIYPEDYNDYITNDNSYLMIDDEKNYYKYNKQSLIKKENNNISVRYQFFDTPYNINDKEITFNSTFNIKVNSKNRNYILDITKMERL